MKKLPKFIKGLPKTITKEWLDEFDGRGQETRMKNAFVLALFNHSEKVPKHLMGNFLDVRDNQQTVAHILLLKPNELLKIPPKELTPKRLLGEGGPCSNGSPLECAVAVGTINALPWEKFNVARWSEHEQKLKKIAKETFLDWGMAHPIENFLKRIKEFKTLKREKKVILEK